MRRTEFERLVSRALDEVPARFADRLKNIAVMVEAHPSREIARELGGDILGLYQGASELEQSPMAPYALPEVIVIYQQNIEAVCRTEDEIVEEGQSFAKLGVVSGVDDASTSRTCVSQGIDLGPGRERGGPV